jgi:serine/threonine protein kinase
VRINFQIVSANSKSFRLPNKGETITYEGSTYTIGERLASGGFAAVYACTDDWGTPLVAKVLEPRNRLSYEQCQAIALREFGNLKQLRHPNITYLHAAFEYEDTFYLIIERCHQTFEDLFRESWFKGHVWFLPLARELLKAVQFMHVNQVVHKDIHPGNVFVKFQADALAGRESILTFKVGDLGIARNEDQIAPEGGTLAQWMLPPESMDTEQFGPVDRRLDIYHSGLLLLALLIGHIPSFTRQEILDGAPRQQAEALRSPYGWVLAKALRRHVAHRTPSALEFWRELEDAGAVVAQAA